MILAASHYTSFVTMLARCTALQICKRLVCMNQVAMKSAGEKPEVVMCAAIINYAMKSEVAAAPHLVLCALLVTQHYSE